jgi:hypothetical protein
MSQVFRLPLVAALAIIAGTVSVSAEEAYFVIEAAGGAGAPYAVTDEVVQRLGVTTFETTLPGMDDQKHTVSGPLLRDLLKDANIVAQTVKATAIDLYEVEVPTVDFEDFDVIAAIELDGKKLSVRDKGPAWIVYPRSDKPELDTGSYETRSVWQLKVLTAE